MDYFKEASKQKLRFSTSRGLLSTEQLWDLSLTKLATIVRSIKKQLTKNNDNELSFLDESFTNVDPALQLSFEVAKAIYIAKKNERDEEKNAAAKRVHNQKILEIIAIKQEKSLQEKSVEELESLLQE